MSRVHTTIGQFGRIILLVAMFLGAAVCATAQTPDAASADARWHYVAGLYGWFPGITGSVTARASAPAPVEVPIDVPFDDLWHHLKMNVTGHFEAGKGPFGLGLDLFYVRLAAPIAGRIPEFIDAEVNLRQFIGEGFGYYRLAQGSGECPWKIEFLGGVRFWDVNTRIESNLVDGEGKGLNWADGFGGLRFEVPLGSRLVLLGRGDVGAGGAKLDWSASGDLAYRLNGGWLMGAGYRTLNVDYDKTAEFGRERALIDLAYNGPRVWIAVTW